MSDSPIARAILRYYPDWDPPEDTGREWIKCLCPFHGEETPSAAVSYDLQGFNCMACSVRGDAISIIRHEEKEVTFAEAQRIAEGLSVGSDIPVPRKPARKPSRRVFGEQGGSGRSTTVRPGVRGRSTPWS
ncbi:DNA primase [Mycobacterium phage Pharaoh]|uniref:DNA primase n=1 Tax=Mycobacterium phage Pharaoh TaxID=2530140 RepID=A0A481W218_9CAUD|nr:DNA primase [Mycobacterium phage Pharaoh]QBJ00270.1 DNA primase [Mycobacterium phage Pharaoh]